MFRLLNPQKEIMKEDKTIIVTGASSGFGFEIAKKFLLEGYRVIALARRLDRMKNLLRYHATNVHIRAVDICDTPALQDFFSSIPPDFSNINCLINNAGLSKGFGGIDLADDKNWDLMVDTNIKGFMFCTKYCLPHLLKQTDSHIINIGSIAAHYPYLGGNVYAATKAFVNNFSLNLRSDLHGKNVRVTCISPGMAKTEFALVRFDGDETKAEALYENINPLTAEDIADAVYWCYSRPSRVNINILEIMPTNQPFTLGFPKQV